MSCRPRSLLPLVRLPSLLPLVALTPMPVDISQPAPLGSSAPCLRAGGDGVVEGLLFATAGEGDPAELVQAFDRLAAWVDRSLDLYKVRGHLFSHVCDCHCYYVLLLCPPVLYQGACALPAGACMCLPLLRCLLVACSCLLLVAAAALP